MYPHFGESRFPPGQDYGTGQARISIDPSRYPYPGFYGPKGSEGSQHGGMMPQRGMMGPLIGKTPGMSGPDGMYGHGWSSNAVNYLGPQSKSVGGAYPMQSDVYSSLGHSAGGYPDMPPNVISMGGYTGNSSFQGTPNPYISGGHYPPYPRIGHPSMMQPHAPASPGVASEGETGFGGTVPPYPGVPSRSTSSLTSGRTWSNQDLSHGGSWPQGGYSSQTRPIPNTNSSLSRSSTQQQQQQGSAHSQTGQQSFGPISPQTPYNSQLTKQSSVSSIRDALLSGPNQSKPYDSPVGPQSSPMTPNIKGTPDQVLSPGSITRQDSQLSVAESQGQLSKQLSVHQLENTPESQEMNSLTPVAGSQETGERPDSLGLKTCSPSLAAGHTSPALSVNRTVSESKTPVLSPITRNHSSILNQYNFSDEQQRRDFLDSLFSFLEKEGAGITMSRPPMICKVPLDLYRVYTSVQQHGGFLNVLEKRLWRDVIKSSVSTPSNINSSSTRTLQHYYTRILLPYECHTTNIDLALCQSKFEASLSRHTSISSPGSQMSSDGEARDRDRVVNHHPDCSDTELLNKTQQVNGSDEHLLDKELESERLGQRVKSNELSDASVSNGQGAPGGTDSGGSGTGKEGINIPDNSENSMDSFSQEMMEPLPDLPQMSLQDAESVLGMATSPYPNQQPPGGPATPSANQNAPSPSGYSSNFPRQQRPGGPFIDMSDISSPIVPPPSYTPSYPAEPSNSPYQISPRHSFPPGYPPHPQYEGDIHHSGMSHHPYMPSSYQSSSSHYPHSMNSQRSMEFPHGMYSPDHMMAQHQSGIGMPHDIPSYPHSMHHDWSWQSRSRMLSPLPAHLQPSLHHRHLQRQQALLQHAHARANSTGHSHSHSRAVSDHHKWQDRSRMPQSSVPLLEDKTKALKASPKPEMTPHNKSVVLKEQSEALKRKLPDWSGCIEGTSPQLMKRRILFSEDCGHVEPWRVMMSLKSGLLAESTWALDTLNILLHDDRTVGYFYLKHHHSLLNTLIDHFKITLSAIFSLTFDDTPMYQPGHEGRKQNSDKTEDKKELFSEGMVTDFDIALKNNLLSDEEQEESKTIVPVSNVFDPHEMHLGRSDDLGHVRVPSVDTQLFFPEPDIDLPIMPQSKRKHLEDNYKLQRIDQTPISVLLKRDLIMSQIPLHRNGRPLRSPRSRERSFLEEVRRRESVGRADVEGISTAAKESISTSGGSRKDLAPVNHSVRPRSDSVFTSPVRTHVPASPTLVEEHEIHHKEQQPLWTVSPSRESLQSRCLCISNILRSLSFIPGNDHEFSQHAGILLVLGKLLLLHHDHLIHSKQKSVPKRPSSISDEKKIPLGEKLTKHEEKFFPPCEDNWWWSCLDGLREDTLVILSNISGQLDLSIFPELISYPIIDGLLHWSVCPSSLATDPLPDTAQVSSLSPQRLVLETLAKMSISEVNVDLILATPPLTRLDLLFSRLGQFIGEKRHPVVRQFALVLLSNLAQGNDASSRQIGQQKMIVILLVQCLEIAEHNACSSSGKLVGGYNPDDPNSLSVAMLRRAATTLHCLSKIPANRTILLCHRDRILYLCASQYIEPSVSSILMDVLFELGKL